MSAPPNILPQACQAGIESVGEVDVLARLEPKGISASLWNRRGMIGLLYLSPLVHSLLHSEFGLTLSLVIT